VPITWDGLRAMMHLGGPDGTERVIATAGAYDPADDNGVRISDYGRRFAGVTAIQPTRPAVIPTVATTVAAPGPAGPAGPAPAVVTPTLVSTTPSPRHRPLGRRSPERQRGARRRPLPNTKSGEPDQRLENWKLRRAPDLPYFLRSTTRESRVRKPCAFSAGRRPGS
jgi:hypothetical protein